MNKNKIICMTGLMIGLYCILSAMMKFTVIGNIQIDLGYIVLSIACLTVYEYGIAVGAIGCGLESILFSAYGFSPSWFLANAFIGLICGISFKQIKQNNITVQHVMTVIIAVFFSMICIKTPIECCLYNIPFAIKIVKNLVAASIDSVTMLFGILLYYKTSIHKLY